MQLTDQEALSEERKAAVLAELARILAHPSFRGSRRCCRFLEYSVQQVLKGSTLEGLKERTIGVEALQRPADYDTSEDAIVRVTANEVRKRLAQYYQGVGSSARPVLSLSLGSYAVGFQWTTPAVEAERVRAAPRRTWISAGIAAGLVLLLLAGAVGIYKVAAVRARAGVPTVGSAATRSPVVGKTDPFWSRVFNQGHRTNIVLSDAVYREIQYLLGRDVSLSEYLAPGYPGGLAASASPEVKSMISFFGRQQTTSLGSATFGSRLLVFGGSLGGDPVIRYPHHINGREFRTDNFILLGSRLSIPWVEMFEPYMNFPLAADKATHRFYLRNRAPKPGEPPEYRESANQEETYADIAVLPNLSGTGVVLILNGIDMVAAESAGEFAVNGSLSAALSFGPEGTSSASGNLYGEVLIRVRALAGTAAKIDVVATRQIAPRTPDLPPAGSR